MYELTCLSSDLFSFKIGTAAGKSAIFVVSTYDKIQI